MAEAKKVQLFQVIARAELSERIPRVPGAFHFALPFEGDSDVDWSQYFSGTDPRAFLVARHPEGHAKEGQVYPLNLSNVDEDDKIIGIEDFLGVIIDGADYEKDINLTVTLAEGIPLKFLQGDLTSPSLEPDELILDNLETLGFKVFSKNIFWNRIQ